MMGAKLPTWQIFVVEIPISPKGIYSGKEESHVIAKHAEPLCTIADLRIS